MAEYDITFTGTNQEGDTDTLKLTITTADTTTTEGGFTGYLIEKISGTSTFDGHSVTLISPGGYESNDNLFSPTGQHFSLDGLSFSSNAFGLGSDKINLYFNGSFYTLSDFQAQTFDTNTSVTVTAVCFVSGTLIHTARGQVAVEDLAVGDLAMTASGEARPIKWIGSRTLNNPSSAAWPVRVMAGAFGENLPRRDLFLSPGHAVCVKVMGEVLAPIGELVNGATIAQIEVDEVTYWHVELESHDVLLAEGLPTESYMDAGNRAWFGREHGRLGVIDPDRAAESLTQYARPFVNQGLILAAIRQRLISRAETLGWRRDSDIDLHLLADGRRIAPQIEGDLARFIFPSETKTAVLVCRTYSPAGIGDSRDSRQLGVMVKTIGISDGLRVDRRVAPDHPALGNGFHDLEDEGGEQRRWTSGRAILPTELWAGCKGQAILRLNFTPRAAWSWLGPEHVQNSKDARRRAA